MAINYVNKATILFLIETGLLPSEAKMELRWCQILDKCRAEGIDNDKFAKYDGAFSASIKEKPWIPSQKASLNDIWNVYWYFACRYSEEVEANSNKT